MIDETDLPGFEGGQGQPLVMSARQTAGNGYYGAWWCEVEGAERWHSGPVSALPNGRITLRNAGIIRLRWPDIANRQPYVIVRGAADSTPLQCQMWFSFNGTPLAKDVAITYDAANRRHVGIGPISDGTLGANGYETQIALFASSPEGAPWTVETLTFGFVGVNDAT